MCSKHVEPWNKLNVKQKFCSSSLLITEINILRCMVSKTSKKNQYTAPQHTPDSWLRYFKFSARSTGWLAWATLKTLLNSSQVLLWYTWWARAFAFTQTAYLLKLVIPTTNALPRWMSNVETKRNARCTAVADSVLMNSRTQILCCIEAIWFSTDAAARLYYRRAI